MKIEKLVKMANQIAMNFEFGDNRERAAAGTADHLKRFWAPPMREAIIAHWRAGGEGLSETAALAVQKLAEAENTVAA